MKLFFEQTGTGIPIFLIHAFPLSSEMWKPQVEYLVEAGFCVITPDLRGFGLSRHVADINSMEDMANDIADLVEVLNFNNAIFCGLSMGGYVLFNLYRLFPEKISALIFCDTNYAADTDEKRQSRFELIEKIEKDGSNALISNMLPNLVSEDTKQNNPDLVANLEKLFSEVNPKSAIAALRGMAERKDHSELLKRISVPTALIYGEEDNVTNLEIAKKMNNQIFNSELFIIENAGHYSNLESPEEFNNSLLCFLNKLK